MTLTVALIAAGVIVLFWRQIAAVVVWLVLALVILGAFAVLRPTEEPAPIPPATGITAEATPTN
jgi:predicted RND superfamily exporter protein